MAVVKVECFNKPKTEKTMPLLDKNKASANLAEIKDRIYKDTNTDPALLSEYRRLFKKKFSFFRRSWAAAWLFMYYDQKETPKIKYNVSDKKEKHKKKEKKAFGGADTTPDDHEHSLPDEQSKKLFVSIGKNRRLFPRDVISLVLSKTTAAREDIGYIKILDNYSFVQVRETKADEIIEALNGLSFRGRNLTVNYAKPKTEEGNSSLS